MSEYRGKEIIIRYDEHTCTHSGNCVKNLPAVFDVNRKPWVNPNDATVEAIKKTMALCPSGALSYEEIKRQ
jgi:uncharacterized Fe-S cluster protein YjdI